MHVLFVHQNFPAQFGHIAHHLVQSRGWRCTFVSQTPPGDVGGVRKVQYTKSGGANSTNNYCSRTFENAIWHAQGVYEACESEPDLDPDLIVGHSGSRPDLVLARVVPGRSPRQLLRVLLPPARLGH